MEKIHFVPISTTGASEVSSSSSIQPNNTPIINGESQSKERKNQVFLDKINEIFDRPFLNTSVKSIDGKDFLIISRPLNDKDRPGRDGVDELCMGSFKRNLGLKDHVISKYNDSFSVTARRNWSDGGTIEKGASFKIPLSELGQEYYLFRGSENEALRNAVKEYQE